MSLVVVNSDRFEISLDVFQYPEVPQTFLSVTVIVSHLCHKIHPGFSMYNLSLVRRFSMGLCLSSSSIAYDVDLKEQRNVEVTRIWM